MSVVMEHVIEVVVYSRNGDRCVIEVHGEDDMVARSIACCCGAAPHFMFALLKIAGADEGDKPCTVEACQLIAHAALRQMQPFAEEVMTSKPKPSGILQ